MLEIRNLRAAIDGKEIRMLQPFVLMRHIWSMGIAILFSDYTGIDVINEGYFDQNINLIKNFLKNFKIF